MSAVASSSKSASGSLESDPVLTSRDVTVANLGVLQLCTTLVETKVTPSLRGGGLGHRSSSSLSDIDPAVDVEATLEVDLRVVKDKDVGLGGPNSTNGADIPRWLRLHGTEAARRRFVRILGEHGGDSSTCLFEVRPCGGDEAAS